jgi:hypothetical protein
MLKLLVNFKKLFFIISTHLINERDEKFIKKSNFFIKNIFRQKHVGK